ncbi:DNA-binding protein [Dysgonomonas sp. 521]|uniref:helix-turn-helix domain-containing protein n=2 Tax=Dysgonomonas sp. 521 TaxID=2302932 RepID=UPI0013D22A9A|nr:helix-turn-helix domain-containing protein [Dysgonomonas sp. 521]NDV97079.1 DNA-binding protein [Dysgonomonas sp. 521]
MEIINGKSPEILSFTQTLEELLEAIRKLSDKCSPALNGEKYLSGKDISRILGLSIGTLQVWRDQGIIPYIQITGKILYKESDVIKLLEENYYKAGL